jgi:hypothetical protein
MRRDFDRLEASRLLADRGWGKAASFEPLEGDPLDLSDYELVRTRRTTIARQTPRSTLSDQPLQLAVRRRRYGVKLKW